MPNHHSQAQPQGNLTWWSSQSHGAPAASRADALSAPLHAASQCLLWCTREGELGTKLIYYTPSARCNRICLAHSPCPSHNWPARSIERLQGWFRGKRGWSFPDTPSNRLTWCVCKVWRGGPSHCQGCFLPLLQFGPTATALMLHGDCSTSQSDTLQPYRITTLWVACMPDKATRAADCPPHTGGGGWDASQLLCPVSSSPLRARLLLLEHSSAAFSTALSRDQQRGQQSPAEWLLGETAALQLHIGRLESSPLPSPCSHHSSLRLWELAGNNYSICFSRTFPNLGGKKKKEKGSKAIGRSWGREGPHIFNCHKLCLGEH